MSATFITVTNCLYYETLREDAGSEEPGWWTVNRNARRGDRLLLYVCAPVSAVVAAATLATNAELRTNPSDEWYGTYSAEMAGLRMLSAEVTRPMLMMAFPDWKYWKQPCQSVRVPDIYLPILERLLNP